MAAIERTIAQASQRAQRILFDIGRELHDARVNRGLSQRAVAAAAGLTQAQVSWIERGLYPSVTITTLARFAAAVGLELVAKPYPASQPIRDKAHVALLDRFRRAIGAGWRWSAEVPLPIPGDKRAWDRLLRQSGMSIGIEGEMHPTDMQELGRRLALKKRDGQVDRLILVLANTSWCRQIIRLNGPVMRFPFRAPSRSRRLPRAEIPAATPSS